MCAVYNKIPCLPNWTYEMAEMNIYLRSDVFPSCPHGGSAISSPLAVRSCKDRGLPSAKFRFRETAVTINVLESLFMW